MLKNVVKEMYSTGKSVSTIIEDGGFVQISNEKEISALVEEVLQENADQVDKYKNGKGQLFGFLSASS